jgi:hypothetical protein
VPQLSNLQSAAVCNARRSVTIIDIVLVLNRTPPPLPQPTLAEMAFILAMRAPSHRRDLSQITTTLPAIYEDGLDSIAHRLHVPTPRYITNSQLRDSSPAISPTYGALASFSDTSSLAATRLGDEKALGIREKKEIAKRGGWKRLALITLFVLICLVGLVVGIVVGLKIGFVGGVPGEFSAAVHCIQVPHHHVVKN